MMRSHPVVETVVEPMYPPFSPWRMLLTCLFINSMIGGSFLSGRVVLVLGYPVAGSIVLFPLSYYILALVADVYGPRTAWRMVWCGMLCLALLYVSLEIVTSLPPAPGFVGSDRTFKHMYGTSPPTFAVIAVAFFIGQAIALYVLHVVRSVARGRALLFRLMGAPLLAQVGTFLLALPIIYAANYAGDALILFTASRLLIAVIYSAAVFPVLYVASRFVRARERTAMVKEVLDGATTTP